MKRKVIMADVHSNITALKSVFSAADIHKDTPIVCLGDIVGYGPDPNECIDLLKDHNTTIIAGNHDAAACGEMELTYFNRLAERAAEWTGDELTTDNRAFLRSLPESTMDDNFEFYHGSPLEPLTEYITGERQAERALDSISLPKLAVGHTHQPVVFRHTTDRLIGQRIQGSETIPGIPSDERLVVNPGSVGQPRDGDPRAAYLQLEYHDNGRIDLKWDRIDYDIASVQERIRNAGLPEALATRLRRGQ